ncbi:MAG: sugar phosphate nucleotidyltransferase, partial [Verrucomicrobiota bacterium]
MRPAPISALVLGAGLGTRLKELTRNLPKPLLPVCNSPLITRAFSH